MEFTLVKQPELIVTSSSPMVSAQFKSECSELAFSGVNPSEFTIPLSFLKGLSDCDNGRVVDMARAIEEPPPNGF
jgi:hypothetical protein